MCHTLQKMVPLLCLALVLSLLPACASAPAENVDSTTGTQNAPETTPTESATEAPTEPVVTTAPVEVHEPYFYPFTDEELAQAEEVARAFAQANDQEEGVYYYTVEKLAFNPVLTDTRIQSHIEKEPTEGWAEEDYYSRYASFAVTYSTEYESNGKYQIKQHSVGMVECFRADPDSPWEAVEYVKAAGDNSKYAMSRIVLDMANGIDNIIAGFCTSEDSCQLFIRSEDGQSVTVLDTDYSAFLPAGTELSQEELDTFQTLLSWTPDSPWYSMALTSQYVSAEDVDLSQFFYNNISNSAPQLTQAELNFIESAPNVSSPEITAVHKASVSQMNKILKQYFGLTVQETNGVGLDKMAYYSGTDSYYYSHGDMLSIFPTVIRGIAGEDGTISLFYTCEEPQVMVVTLRPNGSDYQILSNLATAIPCA